MARQSERALQYRNRSWQCQGRLIAPARDGKHIYEHICQVADQHYGPHRCWCDCLFDDEHVLYEALAFTGGSRSVLWHTT